MKDFTTHFIVIYWNKKYLSQKATEKKNIPKDASFIVIGKHAKLVKETNEEVAFAYESLIPVKSFPEVINDLTKETDNIVVSGSFGKSTCTTFLIWSLLCSKKDPSYFVGALPYNFKDSAHQGTDNTFVLEGDEYPSSNTDETSKFLYYNPKTVLLTSCEHDHINIFPTLESYLHHLRNSQGFYLILIYW
jgi:UDP-N-acetylmuramate: L-alanyl-gamma-D-glutamyl-meso-diaminopimelate ligase